ncbi:MAG: hypothetical protein N3I86_05150 [Verrucomicrobiae bacterium]|nr:hypothetical protein [Verrucomicrobiae bacterium]
MLGALCSAGRAEVIPLGNTINLMLPASDPAGARLVESTFAQHLQQFYGLRPAVVQRARPGGTYFVFGTPETHPLVRELVREGLKLNRCAVGEEGFQILTHQRGRARFVVVHATTPRALKHGAQELLFFQLRPTTNGLSLNWPLDLVRAPEFPYRGIYMLQCWAAHDSIQSWERVLRFNSELTLNRNWFWLDGFPVAGHTGEYTNSPLADEQAVQRLIDLVNAEAMKFYIGGGWFTWHHKKAIGHNTWEDQAAERELPRATDYYLSYLNAFKGVGGFFFEPTGEPWTDGRGAESAAWLVEIEGLHRLINLLLQRNPDLEIAIAIGRWNNPEYLKRMATPDPRRVFWWWCWGDPVKDRALDRFPNVLRWHIQFPQKPNPTETHGSRSPPMRSERGLTGLATSYTADAGFGSPWHRGSRPNYLSTNLVFGGASGPIEFDPYTIPYFYLQYFFRERCWDLNLTEDDLTARLHRRLFDADAPPDAGQHYVNLSRLVLRRYDERTWKPDPEALLPIRDFLEATRLRPWTPRMSDTLRRMNDALTRLARSGG